MSAGKAAGNAATGAPAPTPRADALTGSRDSQHLAPASAPRGQASACKPKQPAHAVRWLVATAALARTVRWPIPEVKPRTALLSAARGSRASTDPGIPPDLLNPTKGLSMAKTAPVSLQSALKSVPVAERLQSAQLTQTTPRKTMFQRSYTLCEVNNGKGQFVSVV